MRIELGPEAAEAAKHLPENRDDGSGVGINYADAYIKAFKTILDDGRKVSCKRRGLKLTLTVGDRKGEGLLRRLEHGPDARAILRAALDEAAEAAGVRVVTENGTLALEE